MTTEMIIKELQKKGYNAKMIESDEIEIQRDGAKNAIVRVGALIGSEEISLDDAVALVVDAYERCKEIIVDENQLSQKEYVLPNLFIGLERESTRGGIKRKTENFDGIESYIYLRCGKDMSDMSAKITKEVLNYAGITEDEAWKQAKANTNNETVIYPVARFLHLPNWERLDEEFPMYVITNPQRSKGAAGILNKKILDEIGKKHGGDKLMVFPSSIHEMIIVPYEEGKEMEQMSAVVPLVNDEMVSPEERLADHAYIINL